jgi:hypothetical protein
MRVEIDSEPEVCAGRGVVEVSHGKEKVYGSIP